MEALWLSLKLAACVAAILLAIGMPVAYWLAYSTWRGKFLLESIVALPLVLPPTVLGFYALVAMGPRGPLGKLWIALFGHGLAFTFTGLILASVLYSFPFAVQPLIASFEGVDPRLLDASAVLGAGALRTFWRVILPLSLPGVVTAAVLSFAHTLGEFGVVLMVGGNLAGVTRTVSIDIYDRVQSLEYGGQSHGAGAAGDFVLCIVRCICRESPRVDAVAGEVNATILTARIRKERRGAGASSFILDVSIEASPGITILFGPSGAGKSTLLDSVAGLARQDEGRIVADGDRSEERRVGKECRAGGAACVGEKKENRVQ